MGADTMTDEQLFVFKDDVNNIVQSLEIEYNGDINTMVINFQRALEISKYSDIFTPMSEEETERISQALMEAANQQDNNDNSGDGNTLSKEEQSELDRLKALEELDKNQNESDSGKDSTSPSTGASASTIGNGGSDSELTDAEKKLKEQSELAKFQSNNQQIARFKESLEFLKLRNGRMEADYFKSMAITSNRQTELKLLSYAFKVAPEGPLPYIKSASTDPLLISEANSIVSVYDKAK
jgi:hypothetical protein